jgi:hypothetical protein
MTFAFLPEGPAVLIENEERVLVIADLHFGIEADLAVHGLHFRSRSRARLDRLVRTIRDADPDRLVLLGDIKHSIPAVTWQEYHELPEILRTLRNLVPLEVFPGNHDIGIERFLKEGELWRKRGGHRMVPGIPWLTLPAVLAGHLLVVGPTTTRSSRFVMKWGAPGSTAYIRAGAVAARLGFPPRMKGNAPVPVMFRAVIHETRRV